MNPDHLREAMHTTLTAAAEPPPMDSAAAITAGRRAVRRRTALTGAGATAALAALAALAVTAGPALLGGSGQAPSVLPAAQPSPERPRPAAPALPSGPSAPAGKTSSKPSGEATASSGPHYQQGRALMQKLLAVVPPGYGKPTGSAAPADMAKNDPDIANQSVPLQDNQAVIDYGANTWSYFSSVAVARGGGTGRLMVEVEAPGNKLPSDPCRLAARFWMMGGQCRPTTVGNLKVGVVLKPGKDTRVDQWAAYRYPDGTVVFVAQSKSAANLDTDLAKLTTLPLTVPQLAALATDQRFHIR
jgi:hypothetical protein